MISDIKQSAKNWLCDCLEIFNDKVNAGDDPSLEINMCGVELELRVMHAPGQYKRIEIEIPLHESPKTCEHPEGHRMMMGSHYRWCSLCGAIQRVSATSDQALMNWHRPGEDPSENG